MMFGINMVLMKLVEISKRIIMDLGSWDDHVNADAQDGH
jgi:hypothetical protein